MPIDKVNSLKDRIFRVSGAQEFNDLAMDIFRIQSRTNPTYQRFLEALNRPLPRNWKEIPCLPISAFKNHRVISSNDQVQAEFKSSGTSATGDSTHYVTDLHLYEQSFRSGFELFYGDIEKYSILGLLPSYLERKDSSLIYMVNDLIDRSGSKQSGFYLSDYDALLSVLHENRKERRRTILFGVTFALLDFVESHSISFPELIVMETGGMKGRRKELIRDEVHKRLSRGLGVDSIHSEYGMTELMSQAYSKGKGRYTGPPWMKVMVRDIHDPLSSMPNGRPGGLNIIDLANIDTCSFIATDDLGKLDEYGDFEVLGRFDFSDIRGCSLMV